jgi:type II secretory pathway predicted ATPase ExeA
MTLNTQEKRRLAAHFGFTKMPFPKYVRAQAMYDSKSQKTLLVGLEMWLDVGGLALIAGPSGVGKSLNIRRFVTGLDDNRYAVYSVPSPPATVYGFLRCLNRLFGLPMKNHTSDLFDAAQKFLVNHEKDLGTHPILVLDDAEGLYSDVADIVRRLTVYNFDAEDRFSILVCGIESLLQVLELGVLEPLRSRFSFAHSLKPFGLEDTTGYIRFHLEGAQSDPDLFSDEAVKRIFHVSQGRPRTINQLCIGALIQCAMKGLDKIDGPFIKSFIAGHPLYKNKGVAE